MIQQEIKNKNFDLRKLQSRCMCLYWKSAIMSSSTYLQRNDLCTTVFTYTNCHHRLFLDEQLITHAFLSVLNILTTIKM